MKARFGQCVRSLLVQAELPDTDAQLPNENAFTLSSVRKESELLVLHNLQFPTNHFVSQTCKNGYQSWALVLGVPWW